MGEGRGDWRWVRGGGLEVGEGRGREGNRS